MPLSASFSAKNLIVTSSYEVQIIGFQMRVVKSYITYK